MRKEEDTLFEECAGDDDNGGGAIVGDDILGFGELARRASLWQVGGLALVEDGGVVIDDDNLIGEVEIMCLYL